jgi:hypothetical protein
VTFAANRAMTHGEAARGERRSNARDALDVRDVGVPAARNNYVFTVSAIGDARSTTNVRGDSRGSGAAPAACAALNEKKGPDGT